MAVMYSVYFKIFTALSDNWILAEYYKYLPSSQVILCASKSEQLDQQKRVSKITEKILVQLCFSNNLQEETQRYILSETRFFPHK